MRTLIFATVILSALIAQATERPNILFCIADDASYPHFGANGCDWVKTPSFDRVAREGLLFRNAYTPNAKCAPSRACILTGRNTWQLEEACNHMPFFPLKFKTYVETLRDEGYFVGKTAKGWAPGVAVDADGKPRQLCGPAFNKRKTKPPASGITSNDYAGNFEDFLAQRPTDNPFCFWYGCVEPHRRYEYESGVTKGGKSIDDIDKVPSFWPDNEVVRNDMLDYAFEIEHFDLHLGRMLKLLEDKGELDNTLVVVTSDNGMPFPRIKGQEYELSNHLPLAVMWKDGIKNPGRKIDDFVSFIDYAPTFLEVTAVDASKSKMQPMTGRSLTDIFASEKSGKVTAERDHVLIGKERHDIGRPNDWGYPIRGIIKDGMLYLKNFEPERWPSGDPITGYLNCDGSPTKTQILNMRRDGTKPTYWQQSFGKRPTEELYRIDTDPGCTKNLAQIPMLAQIKASLQKQLMGELEAQQDPRIVGDPRTFDRYKVATPIANYYERFMKGEKVPAGWVNKSDFEKESLEQQSP